MHLSLDQDMLEKFDNMLPGDVRLELGGIKPDAQQKCPNGSSSVELASVLLLHLRES
jgi:hypothetical protein